MKNKVEYKKLIRDRIPEIIEASGKKHISYVADDSEYQFKLLEKLLEESKEMLETPCLEELADILEVIESLKSAFNFSEEALEKMRLEKKASRGGFDQKLILDYVYED